MSHLTLVVSPKQMEKVVGCIQEVERRSSGGQRVPVRGACSACHQWREQEDVE
jgi:hypothetical protein